MATRILFVRCNVNSRRTPGSVSGAALPNLFVLLPLFMVSDFRGRCCGSADGYLQSLSGVPG